MLHLWMDRSETPFVISLGILLSRRGRARCLVQIGGVTDRESDDRPSFFHRRDPVVVEPNVPGPVIVALEDTPPPPVCH